jgi:ubiquinone/menaquinone biosynthesis C-methylase UbiE
MPQTATATVMFTDLSGSTALSVRLGRVKADVVVQEHFATVREVLARHGGDEVKTLGDGVMAVFPSVTEAVDCSVALQQAVEGANRSRPDVAHLRVGLSVGEVTCEGGDYFGTPVVEAARLCAEAEPMQILCSALVRQLAATRTEIFRALEPRTLKGLPGPFALEEIAWIPIVDRGIESDFSRRDGATAAMAIGALDDMRRGDVVVALVVPVIERVLAARPGETILDVGCGTGADAIELAAAVGPGGSVIGVDHNPALLDEARRRVADAGVTNVDLRVGDATALPVDDHSVDACRTDRVLQYLVEPSLAIREMVRVTRPGGRIVVADTDWETAIQDHEDLELTARIHRAWVETRPSGRVGRQLPWLLRQAGLEDVTLEPVTSAATEYTDFHRRYITPGFATQAVSAGAITAQEASRWVASLEASAERGRFLRGLTMFVASGRVPGST